MTGPHDSLPEEQQRKVQAMVSEDSKARITTCFADRGIHAFLVQHAYENVSTFIRTNKLSYTDGTVVLDYIRNGFRDVREQSDTRTAGHTVHGSVGGTAPQGHTTTSDASLVGARVEKSVGGRGGRGGDGKGGKKEVKEKGR